MTLARVLLALTVPATLAASAFLHAAAISALVEATAVAAPSPALPAGAAAAGASDARPSADALLRNNPFEHASPPAIGTPRSDCSGVRALVVVRGDAPEASIAALDVGGARLVRRWGGAAGDMQIAWIGADRVWLARGSDLCEARVFAPPVAAVVARAPETPGIARVSESEVHVDRGLVDRWLESPGELAKVRVVPEASGLRIVKVPKDSVALLLGLEDGDRIVSAAGIEMTSPEKMLELYARLRTMDRLSIVVVRKGRPMTMDYVVR